MGKLVDEVKKMEDTRQQWKIKHALCDIVIIVMLSILTGHYDFEEMVIFAEARIDILCQYIELKNGIPYKNTLKRVIAILNPNELNFIFYKWLSEIVTVKSKKTLSELDRIIAFDGKTLCGSNDINNKALHILTAFDTDNELVLGQLPVDEKTNEITVMPDLIDLLDLKDTIITADALNCQKEIVEKIVDKKGNYVLAVKGNKGELYDSIVDYFDDIIGDDLESIIYKLYNQKLKNEDKEYIDNFVNMLNLSNPEEIKRIRKKMIYTLLQQSSQNQDRNIKLKILYEIYVRYNELLLKPVHAKKMKTLKDLMLEERDAVVLSHDGDILKYDIITRDEQKSIDDISSSLTPANICVLFKIEIYFFIKNFFPL